MMLFEVMLSRIGGAKYKNADAINRGGGRYLGMKVLLLGATGLLGHNVLQRLVDEGHSVVAVVRRVESGEWGVENFQTIVGSILDYETLARASEGCEAIVNCAGTTDMSLRHYDDYLPVNRDLCGLLVRLMDERGIRTLVHTSTVNTIGFGLRNLPADETSPMEAPFKGSFYADSKREGEQVVLAAAKEGRHVVVVNPGFMLGPWDVKPSSGRMLLAAYRKPLMFAPRGGKAFVHVGDVAQAIVNALTRGENGAHYIVVNSHACMTIGKLYRLQAEVCGYRQKTVIAPDWLLLAGGMVGDLLRWMGVRTQVSTRNVRQLLVCENYSNGRALRDLEIKETPIAEAIREFYEWRK